MFNDFFDSFYYGTLIVSSVCCLLLIGKIQKQYVLLSLLIWLTLTNELLAYFASYTKNGNAIVYNLFTPVEFFLYAYIFNNFFLNKRWTIIVVSCFILLICQEVVGALFVHSIIHDQFVDTNILENVLLVFLSLGLFLKIRTTFIFQNLLLEGIFWFNSAVLFYYGYNVIFWSLFGLTQNEAVDNINFVLSSILYILYTFSIFLNYLKVKRK
jgi:hypothetical protein